MYIVLGILYESYIHPLTILLTLPSAGVGAVLAMLLCKEDLNVIGIIGILLLIGLVKKNAILMVDFAITAEREHGKNSRDAIYEACLLRFRPILMTTMSAIFGALPLILSNATGWRTAPAARHHDCRGIDPEPGADPVYHPGGVFVPGPAAVVV